MIRIYSSRHPINVYPSREGQALQTYVLPGSITLSRWLARTMKSFTQDGAHRFSIDVDGVTVSPALWPETVVTPEQDVRIYPVPGGLEAATIAWIAVGISAVGLAYALSMSADTPDTSASSGTALNLNTAQANTARLYEPIREILGRMRVYPDYVVQPITRFADRRDVRTNLFLCVGAGSYAILPSSIKIGNTPVSAFGDDVQYAIYGPGADVSTDARTENWYVAPEVGASNSATAGLDLDSPTETTAATADGLALDGASVTLIGNDASLPDGWVEGTIITLVTPNNFEVGVTGDYSTIAGPLDDLAAFPGMRVSLSTVTEDIDLVVRTFSPYVPPVPGVGGSPSEVLASAAPTTYDFEDTPVVWTISYQGITRTLSLVDDYINMSGMVSEITSQLGGMGLVAQDDSGRLRILEPSSPYRGGPITQSGAPVALFGVGPTYTVGTASAGGTPEQLAFVTLEYEHGTPFAGLPLGQQRIALGYRGNRFEITGIDALTITVDRLDDVGDVDTAWPGFAGRTLLDFQLNAEASATDNWIGPFMACPEGETTSRIEWDLFMPGGLQSTTKKGGEYEMPVRILVQYADVETGAWQSIDKTYWDNTRDGIGFTEGLDLPYAMRPMVRVRRVEIGGYRPVSDSVQWYGLRSRLSTRPGSYAGVTTIALTVRTGNRLSAQSDRKINLVATRLYENGENRSISGAVRYLCESAGMDAGEVDIDTLSDLQAAYWTPRGETFDHAWAEAVTVKEALDTILKAGMSHPILDGGMISAIREGPQQARGMITPHEQASELQMSFSSPSPDDYTGVDMKYLDPVTFTEETVECRLPGLAPTKIETVTLDGVHDRTRAWRYGMRLLMKYQLQRLSGQVTTEMDALAYQYLDRIILTDDIPGNQTISTVMESLEIVGGQARIEVSELLDWTFPNPRCVIRRQDGTVTRVLEPTRQGDYGLILPATDIDFVPDFGPDMEPPRLLFCSSSSVGYQMMIESIEPGEGGTSCQLNAVAYSDEFYQYDDAIPE